MALKLGLESSKMGSIFNSGRSSGKAPEQEGPFFAYETGRKSRLNDENRGIRGEDGELYSGAVSHVKNKFLKQLKKNVGR